VYLKPLQTRNVCNIYTFCSKLVSFVVMVSHFHWLGQVLAYYTIVHYDFVMFL
jgi:hypothetical protein